MSYQSIVGASGTVTASAPAVFRPCPGTTNAARSSSVTCPSSSSQEEQPALVSKSRSAPQGGKWSEIKESGQIKMTAMHASTIKTEGVVSGVQRGQALAGRFVTSQCCTTTPKHFDILELTPWDIESTWTEQGDFLYWSTKYPDVPRYTAQMDLNTEEVARAQANAWNELLTTWDLGTELAELNETIRAITSLLRAARNPLAAYKAAKARILSRGKPTMGALNELADAWLGVRYGVLPIMYSVQDIVKLYEQKDDLFKTVRRTVSGSLTNPVIDSDDDSIYFYESVNGSIQTRVTCKGKWSSSALRTAGHIRINPITTAWELVPLSFVVDWFINVGDYLSAITGTWASLASQLKGCSAVRKNYQVDTYLHYYYDDRFHLYSLGSTTSCNGKTEPVLPAADQYFGSIRTGDVHVQTHSVDSYERVLFNQHDLSLALSPYLNWKRTLDGSALTLKYAQQALRRLL